MKLKAGPRREAAAEFVFDDQAVQPEVSSLETKSISPDQHNRTQHCGASRNQFAD
jgi:hypothetical protein